MSYTVLEEKMQRHLNEGEAQTEERNLEAAAVCFLRKHCEGLRYRKAEAAAEKEQQVYRGKSLKENQIPYYMQMDIDRLCLERAVREFAQSGSAQDAFNVYFCYLEMFVGGYARSRRMVELLSEYEMNASSLLMKHRDHYSHSVYVFILGLAIYETSPAYRATYKEFYQDNQEFLAIKAEMEDDPGDEKAAAHHYLQYWGLASLFHDIGYPFELPFEQVAAYFEVHGEKRDNNPFVAYHHLEKYVTTDEKLRQALKVIYQRDDVDFSTTNDLFAYDIAVDKKLSDVYQTFTEESMREILETKTAHPEQYNYFMDHAWFSASILFRNLFEEMGCPVTKTAVDAMTAILLHNSLYKFSVARYKSDANKPFQAGLHPLAYMLMLCDELQCWDRTAYGRNSRTELHPMGCDFTFRDNEIRAVYIYDQAESAKIDAFRKAYEKWKRGEGKEPKLKAYAGMYTERDNAVSSFQKDIERIVALNAGEGGLRLSVATRLEERNVRHKNTYLSNSNFLHLYNFAVALNGRWTKPQEWEEARRNHAEDAFLEENREDFENGFSALSLEYKLSNINQAKAFGKYLDVIGCFYTDKPVPYELLEAFTAGDAVVIGPIEHRRWLKEHYDMGWVYTADTEIDRQERELCRVHYDMINDEIEKKYVRPGESIYDVLADESRFGQMADANYARLGKEEQDKDTEPLNAMLSLLKLYDGLRIYQLDSRRDKDI